MPDPSPKAESSACDALMDTAIGNQVRAVGGDRVVRIDAEIAVQGRRLAGSADGEQADAVARVAGDDVAADQVDDLDRPGAADDLAIEAVAGLAGAAADEIRVVAEDRVAGE